MTAEAFKPEARVVLGDDWVGPRDSVESEVRESREKRGLFSISSSPLARKIALFNLVGLVILIAGILFTNPFRESLLRQQEDLLSTSAQIVADVVSAAGGIEATSAVLVQSLSLDQRFDIYFLSESGLVAHFEGDAPISGAMDLPDRTTLISNVLERTWSGLSIVSGKRLVATEEPDFDTISQSMLRTNQTGTIASYIHRGQGDDMWIAASAPVLQGGTITGAVLMRRDATDTARLMRHDREQVLQFFLIALLVSIGLSFVLASTIANPLADLAMAAELGKRRDARKSKPGARVRIPDLTGRPDEIGDLSRAMRGMVNALYDRVEANEQFAADVAHEIKNPLASLRSAVGTLRMAKREDQVQRLLDVVEHDVRRLDRLVSDTSNASRLDAELVKEEEEEFDLTLLLVNLTEHLSREAKGKGVNFIRELPQEPIVLTGLEGRLAQVFVNLISNAISFCEDGDAVRVWARKRGDRVLIVVEDTGPGIPDNALTRVFKRFYSERPVAQFGNHSGLGLAISKQIFEAHQGVIWAENIRPKDAAADSPPLGARFVVGLPL